MTNLTNIVVGPTGLAFFNPLSDAMKAVEHRVYTDEGIEYLRREFGVTEARVFENLACPSGIANNGSDVHLFLPTDTIRSSGYSRDISRTTTARRLGITEEVFSRATTQRRTRVVEDNEFPKGWRKPPFDPKKATAKQLRKALKQAQQAHRADVQTIGREFLAEAQNRGLCAEYDNVIQRINGRLQVGMPVRVTKIVTGTVTSTQEVRVVVSSDATEEEIIAQARTVRSDLTDPVISA
jgi:hypothetical protein